MVCAEAQVVEVCLLLCIYLTGKSTMSLILSLQMKLLKEKRFSWMIKTLGRRHSSSCLEASRCCWHFGQYLKKKKQATITL